MDSHLRILCCLFLTFQANTPPASKQAATSPQQTPVAACQQPCLEDGTPVRLRISQTVSSADAHLNDRVEFEVLEEIKVSDVIVIPKGGLALGTVTEAQHKRRMARGGKLEIVLDYARLADGEKAALRATREAKGGGHTGAMTAGIVATGLLFFPAAPFFLFMHGKDISIPKGTEVPTFVNGNFHLDLAKFQQSAPAAATTQQSTPASQASVNTRTEVDVTSIPSGAEIELDGAFVGNTPSVIGVSAGDHVIAISKKGYKRWERKITVTSGKVGVAADLEIEEKVEPKQPNESPEGGGGSCPRPMKV